MCDTKRQTEIKMATQSDYMMWMNANQMMMPEANGLHQQVPPDMMAMDQQTTHLDNPYYPMQVAPSFDNVPQQPMELDGLLMMEDFNGEYCGEPPRYITSATQTLPNMRRKIMPVKHPGLKLQTPIAFKCDTDPNVIPIHKDGMAICEKCGAIGVKHAFYTRHRKYCSLACARGILDDASIKEAADEEINLQTIENANPFQYKFPNGMEVKEEEMVTKEMLPFHTDNFIPSYNVSSNFGTFPFTSFDLPEEKYLPPPMPGGRKSDHTASYDWRKELNNPDFVAAPVNCFKHAPMADSWDDIAVGMKVEVENSEEESHGRMQGFADSFWVATVVRIAGYKAQLRYEGFSGDNDFWVNLCCANVHHVGWCATRGKPLIPPKTISENCKDWKDFLVRRLTGARTLPSNFYYKVQEGLKSRFRVGLHLEVVDKERISQMCVATIRRIVGKRLHVTYYNADDYDSGFWCHEDSPLIHPVGWSARVGHEIDAPASYVDRSVSGTFDKDDASEELFTAPFQSVTESGSYSHDQQFQEEMRLEAIDPLNLSAICVATVKKVLRDGYLMVRIDSYEGDNVRTWFCYHSKSTNIFPPGFCEENGLTLVPPADFKGGTFTWDEYCQQTGCTLAPASLFIREDIQHDFVEGMHLESADLISPWLVCVASVARVVGRLLKIHFHGWPEEFDQWMDCLSPDVYPVGWCALVSHKLEPEANQGNPTESQVTEKKKKQKGRPGRKSKAQQASSAAHTSNSKKHVASTEEREALPVAQSSSVYDFNDEGSAPPTPLPLPPPKPMSTNENSSKSAADESQDHSMTAETGDGDATASPATVHATADTTAHATADTTAHATADTTASAAADTTVNTNAPYIPRLADVSSSSSPDGDLNPSSWTCDDVATFLGLNDCSMNVDDFLAKKINGSEFLELTNDAIMKITGKIGPTLKIFALIHQLKQKAKASRLYSH